MTKVVAQMNHTTRVIRENPHSSEVPQLITEMWPLSQDLDTYIRHTSVETRITRLSYIMAFWAPYDWVQKVVDDAISSNPIINAGSLQTHRMVNDKIDWVNKLVTSAFKLHSSKFYANTMAKFSSRDFIPGISNNIDYSFKLLAFKLDQNTQRERTSKTVTETIRVWLKFPTDSKSIPRWKFCDSIRRHTSQYYSIFLLDSIWDGFQNPYKMLLGHSTGTANRSEYSQIWQEFDVRLDKHPISNKNSWLNKQLEHLQFILEMWVDETQVDPKIIQKAQDAILRTQSGYQLTAPRRSKLSLPSVTASTEDKMMLFVEYLRRLLPLIQDGEASHLNSEDSMIKKVANASDRLLPFREYAPTRIRSKTTLYSQRDWLKTDIGFWNVLCFRAVFYGSEFARTDCRRFQSLDDWQNFRKSCRKPDSYFVRPDAYGSLQSHRSLDRIQEFWEQRHRWTPLFENGSPSVEEVYELLMSKHKVISKKGKNKGKQVTQKVYLNVGELTAILIIGDLVYGGILTMPTPKVWGKFIEEVSKGALDGLQILGLLEDGISVSQAFVKLYDFVGKTLNEEEKTIMNFDVLMGEHGLCKFKRLYTSKEKKN